MCSLNISSDIDDYFHGKNRFFYALQVEQYLSEAIDEFCSVDASDYESSLDVESAVLSATSYSPDGSDIDEDDAAATLDECVQEEAFNDCAIVYADSPFVLCIMTEQYPETEESCKVFKDLALVFDDINSLIAKESDKGEKDKE